MKTEVALASVLPAVTHGFDGTCTLPVRSCPECFRAWLDRPCPPGSWRDFEAKEDLPEPFIGLERGETT